MQTARQAVLRSTFLDPLQRCCSGFVDANHSLQVKVQQTDVESFRQCLQAFALDWSFPFVVVLKETPGWKKSAAGGEHWELEYFSSRVFSG